MVAEETEDEALVEVDVEEEGAAAAERKRSVKPQNGGTRPLNGASSDGALRNAA